MSQTASAKCSLASAEPELRSKIKDRDCLNQSFGCLPKLRFADVNKSRGFAKKKIRHASKRFSDKKYRFCGKIDILLFAEILRTNNKMYIRYKLGNIYLEINDLATIEQKHGLYIFQTFKAFQYAVHFAVNKYILVHFYKKTPHSLPPPKKFRNLPMQKAHNILNKSNNICKQFNLCYF